MCIERNHKVQTLRILKINREKKIKIWKRRVSTEKWSVSAEKKPPRTRGRFTIYSQDV